MDFNKGFIENDGITIDLPYQSFYVQMKQVKWFYSKCYGYQRSYSKNITWAFFRGRGGGWEEGMGSSRALIWDSV